MPHAEVVILGAGAAGLMCAIHAGKRGRSVTVIEHNSSVGEKIRISGGGRCNFTNRVVTADRYLSNNPHFAHSALARYTPDDFIDLVGSHDIPIEERELGQMFCVNSAQDILGMLQSECRAAGVRIALGQRVQAIEKGDSFAILTDTAIYECESLVVATGGISIPKLGATDLGYRIARQFGLRIVEPRPGLVPLTLAGKELELAASLSGVSFTCTAVSEQAAFTGSMLFTHTGLSGPPILQISSYLTDREPVAITFLPTLFAPDSGFESSSLTIGDALSASMPRRAVRAFAECLQLNPALRLTPAREATMRKALDPWIVHPTGTLGFAKAEITMGGIDTRDLSSKTMESRNSPGLYFIGEVVDVTGWLGGYNFQWAWASGAAAGNAV
jgi:predicted Rossmann fold flavoprotein